MSDLYAKTWLYKVTNWDAPIDHPHRRYWVLRVPGWIGRLIDWKHLRKWGFAP